MFLVQFLSLKANLLSRESETRIDLKVSKNIAVKIHPVKDDMSFEIKWSTLNRAQKIRLAFRSLGRYLTSKRGLNRVESWILQFNLKISKKKEANLSKILYYFLRIDTTKFIWSWVNLSRYFEAIQHTKITIYRFFWTKFKQMKWISLFVPHIFKILYKND